MRLSTLSSTAALLLIAPRAGAQDGDFPVLIAPFSLTVSSGPGQELEISSDRPDRHAPVGVLGAYMPPPGEWNFSYRHVRTQMEGLVDGSSDLTPDELFAAGYSSVPTRYVRKENLFGLDYGIAERWGLSFTLPWISNDMDFQTSTGETFDARTNGLCDLHAAGMYSIISRTNQRLHLNLGLSIPSGSHNETDSTLLRGGQNQKLPYALQPGSGTVDLSPGITYFRLSESASWGAQLLTVLRVGDNSDGYTLGDGAQLTGWVARRFREDLSGSLRVAFNHWQAIDGQDDSLDPTSNPANDPDAYGGDRVDLLVGVNYSRPGGHVFSAEIGGPLFQDLNGPQLETDVIYSISWQISF